MPRAPAARPLASVTPPRVPLDLPRVDGEPRRALASINVRRDEKRVFDLLHSWWSLRAESTLSQQDAASILFALALNNPDADLPADLQRF